MTMADTIRDKIDRRRSHLKRIDVEDESALHAGHAGARPGGETHFRVRIVSRAFDGLRGWNDSAAFMLHWPPNCRRACMRSRSSR